MTRIPEGLVCHVRTLEKAESTMQKPFSLYAVLFVWFEDDIIEACVKNLFAEGVERVFLIDNDSPDKTVEVAVRAGALHVETVVSERFTEEIKCGSVFALTRRILAEEGRERSWWLFCDADEFPTSPDKGTIRDFLARLDDRIRVVGGRWIQHFPVEKPHYRSGFHPAEFQFRATSWDGMVFCPLAHDKHNCIRFDNGAFDATPHGGYHTFELKNPEYKFLYEPREDLPIHHFQYRNADRAFNRLKKMVKIDEQGCSRLGDAEYNRKLLNGRPMHMGWYMDRWRNLSKVYDKTLFGTAPPPAWPYIMRAANGTEHMFNRWYDEQRLLRAVRESAPDEEPVWYLTWTMMYKDRENFLALYESLADSRRLEHAEYAGQCYAARGEHEKALRTALSAREYPAVCIPTTKYDAEAAAALVKKIISGEARPTLPF